MGKDILFFDIALQFRLLANVLRSMLLIMCSLRDDDYIDTGDTSMDGHFFICFCNLLSYKKRCDVNLPSDATCAHGKM